MDGLDGPRDEVAPVASETVAEKSADRFQAMILRMATDLGAQRSFSPTDVAQALGDEWRPLLKPVRTAARRLAEEGRIDILRHGKPIEPSALKGVIRLRLKQA